MLQKCIGIISYFPNTERRAARIDRFNKLLGQLNTFWPMLDILIVTQNWQDYQLPKINNKVIRFDYPDGLGILPARNVLRDKFLASNYDYIIMLDDEAEISYTDTRLWQEFLDAIDAHPNGFSFIKETKLHLEVLSPYVGPALNMCAISKYIYALEPLPDLDPSKQEGFEDITYAALLGQKYQQYAFDLPAGIRDISHRVSHLYSTQDYEGNKINSRTSKVLMYLLMHKELPKDIKKFLEINE